ncbi:ribonuclease P protein component [Bosea sp. (in: a-proteobacteria)]|jgi:ribonuclease P protein component|uniref:ribonuclease P protein component n=1 Tax=Bosea sp. (in: a-proteobacteria) TaxID=1871050 RepID=UPI000A65EC51|nr:ribonuclease P protein component [Bosea sp. (in: a-proteobacteria)]MBN9435652.1 ribonuclease P protein component [Bosea sp. (in: a-proteobacteria)]MBN9448034.1 ribonuclease P protein component [Bosea sp. (in: a-proteobacteria)]
MRIARLTQRRDFLAAAEHGRRFRSPAFTVQVNDQRHDAAESGLRLGLTASRKVGGAVERNRIRRRLRAAAKLALAGQLERPCDVVIVARPETITAGFSAMVADLSVALDRARPGGNRRGPPSGKRPLPEKPARADSETRFRP